MSSFCSVGLSSTLALLEAEIASLTVPEYTVECLQVFYASALNRFLNFAHSLTMTQTSMFGAAKELGIHSFIVDVRHLCSHGPSLPALETLQLCAASCMKWLRIFYWDNLLKEAKDVTVQDMLTVSGTAALNKELEFLLGIYDFTAHQIWRRRKSLSELPHDDPLPESFAQYARSLESDNLLMIRGQLLKDCSVILEKNRGKLSAVHLFCRLLVEKMPHFLTDPLQKKSQDTLEVTVVHQNLFHMIANSGIVGEVLRKLLISNIDGSLERGTRNGAGFWAGQVLRTCSALKHIQRRHKTELSSEELFNLNWESVNTKSLDKSIATAFASCGLNREDSLIFGPSKKNLWAVKFSREFVVRQVKHTTLENKEVHVKLLEFVDPPLSGQAFKDLKDILDSFIDPLAVLQEKRKPKEKVEVPMDFEVKDINEAEEDTDMGIWSCPDEDLTWEKCSIGTHLFHTQGVA